MQQLPKSLHTVTVLVNVAKHLCDIHPDMNAPTALANTLEILKLDEKEDVYDLIGKARKQLINEMHP